MYIGDTTARGLHHLVYEVVDNSIDEAMAGYCRNIHVTLHTDGSVSVADDGRGIPVDIHAESGMSALEVVLTKVHAGGKFDHDTLQGLRRAARRGRDGRQRAVGVAGGRGPPRRPGLATGVREGGAAGAGQPVGAGQDDRHHHPLPARWLEIFPKTEFDSDILEKRLRELAFLNKGVRIRLTDERTDELKDVEFYSSEGLSEFVAYLNRAQTVLHPPVVLSGRDEERAVEVEVALQYNDSISEMVVSYCNNIHTIEGGTHLTGFRTALTRTLNLYAKAAAPAKTKDLTITRRGLQGRAHGDHQRPGARPAVRGPDQDQAGQQRGRGDRRPGRQRAAGRVPRDQPERWPSGSSSRPSWRPRPARRRARPASWFATARGCSPVAGSPAS